MTRASRFDVVAVLSILAGFASAVACFADEPDWPSHDGQVTIPSNHCVTRSGVCGDWDQGCYALADNELGEAFFDCPGGEISGLSLKVVDNKAWGLCKPTGANCEQYAYFYCLRIFVYDSKTSGNKICEYFWYVRDLCE